MIIGQTVDNQSFCLPVDAATQKFAFLARSGAGKTYAATKLAELLYHAGVQIIALDPVGVWYGLRLAADGHKTGLPIPVFGGEYGDIPLESGAGALVADMVVDRGISLILDVSGFRKTQRKEFVTGFAEELFHRKKTTRSPVMFFLEESQFFVPQRTFKGEERMLGAFEDIGKVGRNYGIGLTLISQRPQSVNKDVLNQVEALFVLQMNAAQERKAIRDWIDAQGINAGSAVDELPTLEIGQAYLWSPQWLKFFGKIRIGQKETYNASATPTFDTRAVAPRVLNPKDLQDLRDAMQEVVKQAEARDPAALRRRIGQLEKELKTRRTEIQVERVEVPVLKESQVEQLRQSINSLAEMGAQLVGVAQDLGNALARVTNQSAIPESQKEVSPLRPEPVTTQPAGDSGVSLRAGERRMLEALGRRYPAKLTRTQLATLSRFSVRGGTFSTYFGTLKRAGFLNEIGSDIQITQTGLDYLGYAAPPPAQTAEELLDMWRGSLRAGERKMLDELVSVYPKSLGRAGLAYRAGYEVSGGTFGTYLSTLRRNGLVDVVGDEIRASDTLFL